MNIQIDIGEIIAAIIGAVFGSGATLLVMKSNIRGRNNNIANQSGAASSGDIVGRDKIGPDDK